MTEQRRAGAPLVVLALGLALLAALLLALPGQSTAPSNTRYEGLGWTTMPARGHVFQSDRALCATPQAASSKKNGLTLVTPGRSGEEVQPKR